MAKCHLTAARLRELFHYDDQTGVFVRLVDVGSRASFNKAGTRAGCVNKRIGYILIGIDGRDYYAHRLAWLWVHGKWPLHQIDHINGNRADNRLENLRDVTKAQNMQNLKRSRKDSSTGLLGVVPSKGRFTSVIFVNKVTHRLGTFDTPEQAHAAYIEAKRRLHPGGTL